MNTIKFKIAATTILIDSEESIKGIKKAADAAFALGEVNYTDLRVWWESTETSHWGHLSPTPTSIRVGQDGRVLVKWEHCVDKAQEVLQNTFGEDILEAWIAFGSVGGFLTAVKAAVKEYEEVFKEEEE